MSATGIIDHVVRPHVATTEDAYLKTNNVGPSETYIPTQLPAGVASIVNGITQLFEARTMGDHCRVMPLLARNVVWDAPPFLLSRKGSVRVSSYLFKFVGRQRFVPSLVEVRRVGLNRHLIEVSGTLELFLLRSWLLPATMLLPEVLPIRSTIRIGVNGDININGVVELVAVKWHNLPGLPNFLRAYNGLVFGTVPHLLEPIWSYMPEFIGDDFYKRKRERAFSARHPHSNMPVVDAAKDLVQDTANGVMDYGVDTVHNMWDGFTYLYTNFLEALGFSLGRARAYTATAADLASNVAATTYNTAANIASTATGVAVGTAQKTYETAAGVAGYAYDTAAHTANKTYDAAATTAAKTYDTAANVAARAQETATGAAQGAYEAGTAAAGSAYETGRQTVDVGRAKVGSAAETASYKTQQAQDDFRKGYEIVSAQAAATGT
eukprot:GHRR01012784.1.p1 GENE.GHRR01012784.1~~GHRR01012784.1.p1  ORF type:complete len:437 (-),score=154.01 GHRR01012784.1:1418-2728(-)